VGKMQNENEKTLKRWLTQEQKELTNNVKKIVVEEEKEKSVDENVLESIRELNKVISLLNDQTKMLKKMVDLTNRRIDLLEINK